MWRQRDSSKTIQNLSLCEELKQQIQSSNNMYQQRIELDYEIEECWKHLGKQGDWAAKKQSMRSCKTSSSSKAARQ